MRDRLRGTYENASRILQRLFHLQEYSLARYAAQAELYSRDDNEESFAAIREIAEGQSKRASKIARLLARRRVPLAHRGFPLSLTGLNYVSARHVVRRLLAAQPALLADISTCAAALTNDAEGRMLAHEVLAGEKANLRTLYRVARHSDAASSTATLAA